MKIIAVWVALALTAAAAAAPAPKGRYAALDSLPDWDGAWFVAGVAPASSVPKLKGQYLAAYEKWRQEVKAKDGEVPSAQSNCMPLGMPVMMMLPQYPIEFLFTPGRVTTHHEAYMQWRTLYTDGRKHPGELDPTFQGDSVGRWEGETLVVETIGIQQQLGLTLATRGPAPAHSPMLRVVERIRLDPRDPNVLINEMKLEDPHALAEPYTLTITYKRQREQPLLEFICAENDRNPVDAQGNSTFIHE
jgi:hypothetical protein